MHRNDASLFLLSITQGLTLVERHLDGDGLQEFLADLDVDLGAHLGVVGTDEGGADVLAGAGAHYRGKENILYS